MDEMKGYEPNRPRTSLVTMYNGCPKCGFPYGKIYPLDEVMCLKCRTIHGGDFSFPLKTGTLNENQINIK